MQISEKIFHDYPIEVSVSYDFAQMLKQRIVKPEFEKRMADPKRRRNFTNSLDNTYQCYKWDNMDIDAKIFYLLYIDSLDTKKKETFATCHS